MRERVERDCSVGKDSQKNRRGVASLVMLPSIVKRNNALLWGLAAMIIASMVGWYFRLLPTSIFGVVVSGYVPLHWYLLLNAVVWITWSSPFYLCALILNRKVDSVELFGRMLFARIPAILVMLIPILGDRILFASFVESPLMMFERDALYATIATIAMLVICVWTVVWSYQAFVTSLRGAKGIRLFAYIATLPLAWWISRVATEYVVAWILQ